MAIANVNDGTDAEPRLQVALNLGTVWDLPPDSAGPAGSHDEVLAAIAEAGFEGVQGGDPARCAPHGLRCSAFGRVDTPGDALANGTLWRDLGNECATVHVGTGFEDDAQIDRLIDAIVDASATLDFPIYVETHRATITQDTWRTLQIVERHPGIRFNGDFSHWYTGLEMSYGDLAARVDALAPVFERTRYLHGRVSSPGQIQIDVEEPEAEPHVAVFRDLWTRAMAGFLATAAPGDVMVFAPELLPSSIHYAPTRRQGDGALEEAGDRWTQALRLAEIARDCFSSVAQR